MVSNRIFRLAFGKKGHFRIICTILNTAARVDALSGSVFRQLRPEVVISALQQPRSHPQVEEWRKSFAKHGYRNMPWTLLQA
jgi:hypothetical protein